VTICFAVTPRSAARPIAQKPVSDEAVMTKCVIAPDKFKGCLTAAQVARAIAAGLRTVDPMIQIDECPMADGGEGTVAALVAATGGRLITRRVTGPLPEMKVDATFGMLGDGTTAIVEMAAASGLDLLKPEDRNPLYATTFGTGELLNAAIAEGAKHIILGIGGSATCDGGIGCAQACGHTIILEDGEPVSMTEPLIGNDLGRIVLIKRHRGERTDGIPITVACDVDNPLYGPHGAAIIYGPQKGGTHAAVKSLDGALRQLAIRMNRLDLAETPGAGAAGGLGFGMLAYFGAALQRGVEIVIDAVKLRDRLQGSDLCFTGEGRLDAQSDRGKTTAGVAEACRALGIPCIAVAGSIGEGAEAVLTRGMTAYFSICDGPMTLDEARMQADRLLAETAANVMRLIRRK
jgi:glycerate kinase